MITVAPLAGPDVRGFYASLGIELPARATREAAVRCFADPGAHRHADRHASMSVSLVSGAWFCHGCGAGGGAYDAALALGRSPRGAIDLMITHGLTERRLPLPGRRASRERRARKRIGRASVSSRVLEVDRRALARYAAALQADTEMLASLARGRRWNPGTLAQLGIGLDTSRIVIPVHGVSGDVVAVLRYDPRRDRRGPKLIAQAGSARSLYPAPESIQADEIVLVEGEPDAIAAISAGLSGVAVPGTGAWRSEWAARFSGRRAVVIADADADGRAIARRIAAELRSAGAQARAVDLHPAREDGADLTDWLKRQSARRVSLPEVEAAASTLEEG